MFHHSKVILSKLLPGRKFGCHLTERPPFPAVANYYSSPGAHFPGSRLTELSSPRETSVTRRD